MKKLVSLVLAVMLFATAFAMADEAAFNAYEEPTALSVLSIDRVMTVSEISYDETDPRRIDANHNIWIDAYKNFLNLDVTRIIAEDDTAVGAQVNTRMASNDLPDVIVVDKALFYSLVENDALVDMKPYWEDYKEEAKQPLLDTYTDAILEAGMLNGCLYGLASNVNAYNSAKVLWVRQDWLNKVDMEVPQTWDDLLTVADAFINAELGGDYTIGIGFNDLNDGVLAAFDVALNTWTEQEDGSYIYANTSDKMREGLLAMQEAYNAGLFNKDFAVSGGIGEEVANGHCGLVYGEGWVGSTDVNNSYVNDNSAEWIAIPVPTVTGERYKQWGNNTVDSFVVVTKNCEHPEAVLKMLDLELYLCFGTNDLETIQTYYAYDYNGQSVPVWNLRAFRDVSYTDLYDLMVAHACRESVEAGYTLDDPDKVPAWAWSWFLAAYPARPNLTEEERIGMIQSGWYGFGNGTCWQSYKVLEELNNEGWLIGEYPGPRSETMNVYWKSIDEALNAAALEVIMGADISVYDEAIAAWYVGGGQTITDEVTAYYQANK